MAGEWHNNLSAWIVEDMHEKRIRQGPRQTLQRIADRCDPCPKHKDGEPVGSEALLVCFGSNSLIEACN